MSHTTALLRGATALAFGYLLTACGAAESEAVTTDPKTGSRGVFEFVVEPKAEPKQGENTFRLHLRRHDDQTPVAGALLDVAAGMPSMGMDAPVPPVAVESGGGEYDITDVVFSMAGPWEVTYVAALGEESDDVSYAYEIR